MERGTPLVVIFCLARAALLSANTAPNAPIITEPASNGQIVSSADVHMEAAVFSDPDAGDTHVCSDWQIMTVTPSQTVWQASCVGGIEKVHIHLGDGTFVNAYAGRHDLIPEIDYKLRVRHRDSSGDPATEWSAWSERTFRTAPLSAILPMEVEDVVQPPTPQWVSTGGPAIILPADATPPSLKLESGSGQLLLAIRGLNGSSNQIENPAALAGHVELRVSIDTGSLAVPLVLPQSKLSFTDEHGGGHSIYLPSLSLTPPQTVYFWISINGSSYIGTAGQSNPDFSTLAQGAPVPWTVKQAGYVVEIVATGFQLPVNIAFVSNPGSNANDPYYYVTELYGNVKVVTRGGAVNTYASNLLNYSSSDAFPGKGEQGLAGVVVDPSNGDVLVSLVYAIGSPLYPKVLRLHSNDGGRTAATQTTLLDCYPEAQGQSHQISNLSIGPDGKLYVHVGDGFVTSSAQNLNLFLGKILRVNLNGSAPSDNPFYDASDGITAKDYIYASGLRNPFGGAWRASDNKLYEVENGPDVDRFAQIVAGRNYLWDGGNGSMSNYAIYNWSPARAPVNVAFVQSATFGGSGFPPEKMDHAFVTESGPTYAGGPQARGKRIVEFVLDASGNRLGGPTTLIEYTGSGRATAVALAAGPDGLYFSDFYKDLNTSSPADRGASILRIRFDGSDGCPNDPAKAAPGICGCGVADTDSDGDGTADCHDGCVNDPLKTSPGACGCGKPETAGCTTGGGGGGGGNGDGCPNDPDKSEPGLCGCGVPDTDTDGDGTPDCHDACPNDANKLAAGICGCDMADTDTDGDGTPDCNDDCPKHSGKTAPGVCGCGISDADTDGDGVPDCNDGCPLDAAKLAPGQCGCGNADNDQDQDGVLDCLDNCVGVANPEQSDSDGNGIGDACDSAPAGGQSVPEASEPARRTTFCATGIAQGALLTLFGLTLMQRRRRRRY